MWLLSLVAALTTGWIAVRHVARSRLFAGASDRAMRPAVPDDVVVDRVVARDGAQVRALELSAPSAEYTLVHFHNNRETADGLLDLGRAIRDRGVSVVLVEYRGYGASPADGPTEEGLYDDAEAVLDALSARGVTWDRIALWGTSLGTGVAAEMARRGRGSRLVLVSPYTSIPELVTDVVPFLPARLLMPDHFDTSSKAATIRIPTLVVHGDADEVVPFWMGEELTRRFPAAHLRRVPGGGHAGLMASEGGRVLAEMVAFVKDSVNSEARARREPLSGECRGDGATTAPPPPRR
jgi:fermentation-respiration switch protein FrsA (DUF1100 family)